VKLEVAAPAAVKTDSGAIAALVMGLVSLPGLVLPPLLIVGVAGVVIGWTARRRIARSNGALKGTGIAIAGLALGVLGTLLSLVIPGFFVSVWIYAAFHGGRLPFDSPSG
jgi:mannose/fructose/N-acetylgalactosamine-specific phosphotransferase system component IIC